MFRRLERVQALSRVYCRLLADLDSQPGGGDWSAADIEREKAQADVAIGLLQEYGQLYRHYDTQRAAYVSALTAIAVTATAADFYAKLPIKHEFDLAGATWGTHPLGAILFALGFVGYLATRKSRLRMKLFYERFSALRTILNEKFPDLQIEHSVTTSRDKIERSGPLSRLYTFPTRGFAWDMIPIFLVAIGGLFLFQAKVIVWPGLVFLLIIITFISDVIGAKSKGE